MKGSSVSINRIYESLSQRRIFIFLSSSYLLLTPITGLKYSHPRLSHSNLLYWLYIVDHDTQNKKFEKENLVSLRTCTCYYFVSVVFVIFPNTTFSSQRLWGCRSGRSNVNGKGENWQATLNLKWCITIIHNYELFMNISWIIQQRFLSINLEVLLGHSVHDHKWDEIPTPLTSYLTTLNGLYRVDLPRSRPQTWVHKIEV